MAYPPPPRGPQAPPPPDLAAVYAAQKRKQNATLLGVSLAAVVFAVLGGLIASGALRLGGAAPKSDALQARGRGPDPSLSLRGQAPPPTLQQVAEKPLEMPQDVFDWLEHLRRCEELKRELTRQQVASLTGMQSLLSQTGVSSVEDVRKLSDPDSTLDKVPHNDALQNSVRETKVRWTDLADQFAKFPPPEECRTIAEGFANGVEGIASISDTIGDLVDSLDMTADQATSDIYKRRDDVQRIGRTHERNVDAEFQRAQTGLEAICAKYGKKPWFSIDVHGDLAPGVFGQG